MARQHTTALLGHRYSSAVVRRLAVARGQALALVYHRVRPDPAQCHEVVPCVPLAQFRRQVEALQSIGDIVPIRKLITRRRCPRPRFALTFDDDYASHFRYVLPILGELGVTATFFLSGRSLHGLGPYWWEVLEARIRQDGLAKVADALDVPTAEPHAIAAACEADPGRQHHLEATAGDVSEQLSPSQISALATSGMTVGFHTVTHPILTRLAPLDRHRALTEGRDRLEGITGQRMTVFAYPHGHADTITAGDVRAVGYESAWTGISQAVAWTSDRWLLGRWEAGPVDPVVLRARALVRLLRPVPTHG